MSLVSVISGAYNICCNFHCRKSIESVLSQTFSCFEFVICDDGSSDNTWELLMEYAKRDKRIKLLRNEENLGLAASLNKCISVSEGEFIARHDFDDYNDPRRLEKQIAFLSANNDVSVLGCNVYLFDEKGVWGKERFPTSVRNESFLFNSPYKHGAVMFRRQALIKVGGYRVARETLRAEDYDLFMRLQVFCRGANLDEYLYYYCEDKRAQKRRKYRYRIDETHIRYKGFKMLGLLPLGLPYVIKPLVVGLIPCGILNNIKDVFYGRRDY